MYTHTVGYYSTIKRNEVLIPATIWTNLENVMLTERNRTPKDTLLDLIYMKCPEWVRPQKQKTDLWLAGARGGGGKGSNWFNGFGVSFWGDENILELDKGDSCTILWVYASELCNLK